MTQKLRRISLLVVANTLVSVLIVAGVELYLTNTHYEKRHHSWLFQNEEFVQEGEYRNFFTLSASEIFSPRPNTSITPGFWETDEDGFRRNPAHYNGIKGKKILVIGDSYAYGHGVSHAEAWPAVLEDQLNKNDFPAIVYNAAVPATGTDTQYVRLSRFVQKVRPKIVIWSISFNDMAESRFACLYTKMKNGTYIHIPGFMNVAYINAFLTKYLPKWFVRTNVGNVLMTFSVRGKDLFTMGCSQDVSDNVYMPIYFDKLVYLLKQAKYLSEKEHFKLLVSLFPTQTYLDHSYPNDSYEVEFLNKFLSAFNQAGVRYINLGSVKH